MEIRIIKGTNQIGGCITEISTSKTKIIIDFGKELSEEQTDISIEGLTSGEPKYKAVFITHSHGDHIGLINNIDRKIPVYVENYSLKIYNITSDFCGDEKLTREVNIFNLNKYKQETIIIDDIKVTPYRIDHSSYNSCMFLIEAEGKRILHTGDFRLHGKKKEESLRNIEKIGKVDLLITEGTTLSRTTNRYKTEEELKKAIDEIMSKYDQVFVLSSSTNIDRTVSIFKSAISHGKNYVLDLSTYALNKVIPMNIRVDFNRVFVWKPKKYKNKNQEFKDKYMNFETSSKFGEKYAMNIKGSMLEDLETLKYKNLITNGCLIYSMWDGYIEKQEKLRDFIDEVEKMGIKFIKLHTSGHADLYAMKKLNELVNPDSTVIIHTEEGQNGKDIFNNVINLNDGDKYIF